MKSTDSCSTKTQIWSGIYGDTLWLFTTEQTPPLSSSHTKHCCRHQHFSNSQMRSKGEPVCCVGSSIKHPSSFFLCAHKKAILSLWVYTCCYEESISSRGGLHPSYFFFVSIWSTLSWQSFQLCFKWVVLGPPANLATRCPYVSQSV